MQPGLSSGRPPRLTVRRGRPGRPVAILIHGLGVDSRFWFDPGHLKVFAGLAPLGLLIRGTGGPVPPISPIVEKLAESGIHQIAWDQARPMGPIEDAVEELDRVVAFCRREFPGAPIALIGHSRGGLVARLWLRHAGPGAASALITLASPHEGSTLARWADVFRPIGKNLERRFPRKTYGGLPETALGRIIDFLGSTGVEELVPDGPVAAALADRPAPVTVSASFGGSDPLLFGAGQGRGRGRWGIPSSLRGLVPDTWWPDEWTDGQGDGLVTVKSSVLPGGRYHRTTGCNHVTIAFVESVAEDVRRLLVSM